MKEQIIIDGKLYNPCNGCELWNGHHCTGDRSYEPNGKNHKIVCNEHLAKEFWKVRRQLIFETKKCKELKRKVELMMDCPDCKVDEYKKALEEIEEVWEKDKDGDYDFVKRQIFNSINKAKSENK